MDSWYVLKMRNVPTRFNLSENAKVMLQTLEDYRVGAIDEFEIGRMLRLSAEKRKSISDTIRKCASLMEKKPAEMKTCILVIEMCTEILDIASKCSIASASAQSALDAAFATLPPSTSCAMCETGS